MYFAYELSALVLPWVLENTRVEHGVDVCVVDSLFLEVLFINWSERHRLLEYVLIMEVLICRLRES